MKAGIIAAGEGSRLKEAFPGLCKPLIPVAGVPLCHWIASSLKKSGINDITILLNSRGKSAPESLRRAFPDVAWTFLEKDTDSSWESFRLVCRQLASRSRRFLISTVDALVPPAELARFAAFCLETEAPAALALTDFIDDEKPLWADLGPGDVISRLGPSALSRRFATVGLYGMNDDLCRRMDELPTLNSLRDYWIHLSRNAVPLSGIVLSKTLDVDRPQDVEEAESFVRGGALWPVV